jgi:hypothetical protein
VTRTRWLALVALVALSWVAQAVAEHHVWYERVPGFYALFGFLGCMAIIFLSKWFGQLLVQRGERYYDRE